MKSYEEMNITSFSSSLEADRMANIDSSSTAHLTTNATNPKPLASLMSNSSSDPELDRSIKVSVIPSGKRKDGLRKQKCGFWYRMNRLERALTVGVAIFATISMILLISVFDMAINYRAEERRFAQLMEENDRLTSILNNTSASRSFNRTTKKEYCTTPNCVKVAASVIEAIDISVNPCDDFYMFSCGDWIKSNPLPDGKANWGAFTKLWQDNQAIMRSVLESNKFSPGSAEDKARIYYESCLDRNDTVESRGIGPIQELIESTGGWNISGKFDIKNWDIQTALEILHNHYNRAGFFSWAVGADERNSTRNVIQLDQNGLGLPSRDFYLNKTDKNVLDAYLLYMIRVAELMGGENVDQQMEDVLELETKLANLTLPIDQRRDDERMYHKFTLKELTEIAPFLNWTRYFEEAFDFHSRTSISDSISTKLHKNRTISTSSNVNGTNLTKVEHLEPIKTQNFNSSGNGTRRAKDPTVSFISKHKITDMEQVVLYSPEYYEDISNLIIEYNSTDRGRVALANYLAWGVIQSLVAALPKNFRDASRPLRKALIGSETIDVSWRYCVTDTNQLMGFALGSAFVRRVFQGNSKGRAEEMIDSIRNAFKDNLINLNWMDDRTRMLAKEKADHINQMIGFPDFILSPSVLDSKYEGLELDEDDYFENNIKVNVLALRENMEKIDKPANKTEWEMTPPMVNAYYTPTKNQIVFPAGILQTPFYDLSFPDSLNFGAMGVVMGHELTHAFDDQGREYDKDGNLYQWWNNETLQNFEERVKCFVDQYSSYKIDDNNLNGKQTLGENIADNGGLKAAFKAYEKWAEHNPEPNLPGMNLTSKQLFFVGFAQVWCSINTPESLKLQVLNDPHSPAQFRVIGTLSNSYEFAREFNCPVGSKMNPEKKCIVW